MVRYPQSVVDDLSERQLAVVDGDNGFAFSDARSISRIEHIRFCSEALMILLLTVLKNDGGKFAPRTLRKAISHKHMLR